MTMGLFEVGNAHESNEIRLNKELIQTRDDLKTQTAQVEDLTKQLSKMKTQQEFPASQLLEMSTKNETMVTRCSELEAVNVSLTQEAEQSRNLNETLKKSIQDAQVDLLSVGDEAFERAKAQALCITPDLDVSKMDFFKTVMNRKLVDMDDISPEAEGSKGLTYENPTS